MRTLSATWPAIPAFGTPRSRDRAGAEAPSSPASSGVLPAVAGAIVDPDLELARRARRGDAEAYRELVDRHRDRAFAVARRIVRSDADAEEVAQDAFVRAWRALPDFRGDARFGTWLHAIVVRRALDRAQTLQRRRGREVSVDAVPEPSVSNAPDLEAVRRARRMDALMRDLSEVQRAAVSLYYFEDRSVEHVAQVLGLPENTVKTHLSRARAALRAGWQRQEGTA